MGADTVIPRPGTSSGRKVSPALAAGCEVEVRARDLAEALREDTIASPKVKEESYTEIELEFWSRRGAKVNRKQENNRKLIQRGDGPETGSQDGPRLQVR